MIRLFILLTCLVCGHNAYEWAVWGDQVTCCSHPFGTDPRLCPIIVFLRVPESVTAQPLIHSLGCTISCIISATPTDRPITTRTTTDGRPTNRPTDRPTRTRNDRTTTDRPTDWRKSWYFRALFYFKYYISTQSKNKSAMALQLFPKPKPLYDWKLHPCLSQNANRIQEAAHYTMKIVAAPRQECKSYSGVPSFLIFKNFIGAN